MIVFKNRLKEAREEYGMSISKLAVRTDVSRTTITSIERHLAVPRGDTMLRIAAVLKMNVNKIFWIEDEGSK